MQQTEQFEDEIHPRLRFAHRGLVGMANNGAKNTNDSQFFITLGASFLTFSRARLSVVWIGVDRADELHGKHTLFGRCVGDTIYSGSFNAPRSALCRQLMLKFRCHEDRRIGCVTHVTA
jgi:cyclophilin family peptidyl-prolyl cis-trans isomerase